MSPRCRRAHLRFLCTADDLSEALLQRLEGLVVACRMQRDAFDAVGAADLRAEDDMSTTVMMMQDVRFILRR